MQKSLVALCVLLAMSISSFADLETVLQQTILPEQQYHNAKLTDVLEFLSQASGIYAPAGVNTKIEIIYLPPKGSVDRTLVSDIMVTLEATNISIYSTLENICEANALKFRVQGYKVLVSQRNDDEISPKISIGDLPRQHGEDAFEVYAVVVKHIQHVLNLNSPLLLAVNSETNASLYLSSDVFSVLSRSVDVDLLKSFRAVSQRSIKLTDFLAMRNDIQMLDEFDLLRFYQNSNSLQETYKGSNGFMGLSAVCFNEKRTSAIVYATYRRSSLSGIGLLCILDRIESTWVLRVKKTLWVS